MQASNTTKQQPNVLRTEIRKEFLRRCKKNESYSLRAFAGFLGMDQSLLSKIMNGQREVSQKLADQLAIKLKLDPAKAQLTRRSPKALASLQYVQLLDDQINILSDWTHYAILELAKTKSFRLDKKWIAKRLGARPQQIEDALERLERLKLISIQGDALKLLRANNEWTNTQSTTQAKKELQRNLLALAQESLENTPFEERENGSLTVAVKKSRMPEFKQKLNDIRAELDAFFQPAEDAAEFDEVYQLTIALFPLSKRIKSEEKL